MTLEDKEAALIEEAVFMQSYIPTSLNEINNPHIENDRIMKGQREKFYGNAISNMLAGNKSFLDDDLEDNSVYSDDVDDNDRNDDDLIDKDSSINLDDNLKEFEISANESDSESDGNSDSDESTDSDSDDDSYHRRKTEKYSRHLPSHNNIEARNKEKEIRKLNKKLVKEEKAEKRKTKLP
eukprot:CAMPEP_0196763650 /NCGR_PEP_ID=MMETSP1095-20130614/4462_1 /TAXON_ID=96789 ORGANISM="Chromulina nebulosa, Strain UTEXLB2642" /NCGR_SAMPLE_ID=MMETSP1095 /ASSEMBLY_ACC=CAM_ASM_000446 /LENGTH=180 /DNA_ID=CAMNT_0042117269 /DNA_START=871 /DNA_END=1410 /DNA_ORIENTATION=-